MSGPGPDLHDAGHVVHEAVPPERLILDDHPLPPLLVEGADEGATGVGQAHSPASPHGRHAVRAYGRHPPHPRDVCVPPLRPVQHLLTPPKRDHVHHARLSLLFHRATEGGDPSADHPLPLKVEPRAAYCSQYI